MNLYEKLNRLDDSLVEAKRVVKKKKLTESVDSDKEKLMRASASVKCKLDDDTIEYAMYDVDDFIENELVYCGKLLLSECPDMLFWRYVSDENLGSYCAVYESDEEFADAFYQISHDRVYDITDEVNGDYDDDIDEMLTENRYNPYFTPYGYRDAAKVLNGKAPEYYYHLKEVEMDRGDGVKLARYAMRKGLPVMIDKNSDPDYPEFAIKGEYHWNDYFYPYPMAHEEDLVAWDGKMFVEEQLTEGRDNTSLELIANQIVEYAKEHPDTLKNFKYMYDYIDNLSQEGRFEIPAKVGQFVLEDPENVTEFEAEEFINMLLDETDISDRLIQIKEANRKDAWDKLRKQFPSL